MKNLKRILSLALASVMVMGMMVVGASAANFVDEGDITASHKNAILTLNALGIMNGKEGGKLDPKGTLTRAEMATMIAVVMNRGTAPNFGTKPTPTFSDIDGHWAESYIEYVCSVKSNGVNIMNGVGGGKFNPEAKLTATTAARTILNAMGYTIDDPKNWELLTEVQARQDNINLYDGLDKEITDPSNHEITREQFAHMLNTALTADMADGASYTYQEPAQVVTGLATKWQINLALESNGTNKYPTDVNTDALKEKWDKLEGVNYETKAAARAAAKAISATTLSEGTFYTLSDVLVPVYENTTVTKTATQNLGNKFLGLKSATGKYITSVKADPYGTYTVKTTNANNEVTTYQYVAEDVSGLMGQEVKAVYKALDDVYGIFASGSQIVWEGTVGEVGAVALNASGIKEITLGDKKIRIATQTAATVPMISFNGSVAAATNASHASYDDVFAVKAVGNAKGYVTRLIATPVEVGTVTFLNNKNITISGGLYTGVLADIETYEGVARNDTVIFTSGDTNVSGDPSIVKAEKVSGTITSVKNTDTVAIDGTWYKNGTNNAGLTNTAIRSAVTLTVLNGYYIDHVINTSISNDLVVVMDAGQQTSNLSTTYLAKVLRMDGTTEVVDTAVDYTALKGEICTFNVVDDVYTLTKATPVNTGYTGKLEKNSSVYYVGTGTNTKGKLSNGALIADDAVVLIAYKNATSTNNGATSVTSALKDLTKTTAITGKDLKTWVIANYGAGTTTTAMITKVNGVDYVKVLFLAADMQALPGVSTTIHGYVVSDVTYTNVNNSTHAQYTVWNGEENIDVSEATTSTQAAKGKFIKFDLKAGNVVENVTAYTVGNAAGNIHKAAIMGYDAEEETIILRKDDGTTEAIQVFDKYSKFFTIDSTTQTGVAGVNVQLASQNEDGSYTLNAYYTTADRDGQNGDDTIDLLFVENYNAIIDANGDPEAASEKAAELAAPASEKTLAEVAPAGKDVFTLGTGAKANITGVKNWNAAEGNLVFFKFDATYGPATQEYTLTIGTTIGGNEVYEETAANVTNAVHFFGIDKTGASLAATGAYKTGVTGLTAGTHYTYTIKGADGIVYASGAFEL